MFRFCCSSDAVAVANTEDGPTPKAEEDKVQSASGTTSILVNASSKKMARVSSKQDANGLIVQATATTEVQPGTGMIMDPESGKMVKETEVLRRGHREAFDYMDVLGNGSFGYVLRVRHKITKKYYAMKLMNYDETVSMVLEEEKATSHGVFWWPFKKKGEKEAQPLPKKAPIDGEVTGRKKLQRWTSINEEGIHDKLNHCFIVSLFDDFHTETTLFMVMELIEGRTVSDLMNKKEIEKLDKLQARKYLAQLMLGIEYIHSRGCVHRDLKPDNVMITEMGIVKIMDLGLAFEAKDHESSRVVGGRGFKAPEMLTGQKYKFSVDWWNYGILVFVLLTGKHPFHHKDHTKPHQPAWPSKWKETHPVEADLIEKLLEREPTKRLGCSPTGESDARAIKQHSYFSGVDFAAVAREGEELRFKRKNPFMKKETPRFADYAALKQHIRENKERMNVLLEL